MSVFRVNMLVVTAYSYIAELYATVKTRLCGKRNQTITNLTKV